MKQFSRCLLLSLIVFRFGGLGDAFAAPVTRDKALDAARAFFSASSADTRGGQSPLELVWDGESAVTRTRTEPAFFVFNRTDVLGFVIVSGDDKLPALLGYSFENSFRTEGMPDNIRAWFSAWREMIFRVRGSDRPRSATWDAPVHAGEIVRQLHTAEWNQNSPYNDNCPLYGGVRTLTGCVATAAAIVVRYHRWPERISGTVPSYTTELSHITVPERTLRNYDYDQLLDASYNNPGTSYTVVQAAEVARLMADLGAMCLAEYGVEATGAYTNDLLKAMVTYMGYDKGATEAYRYSYSDAEWIALMKREIDADRPVLYAGSGVGAHQFVLDGYDDRGWFHFNWGWDGHNNGVYNSEAVDFEFRNQQSAIVDLKKDPQGVSEYKPNLCLGSYLDTTDQTYYSGITADQSVIRRNESFTVLLGPIYNCGASAFTGWVKLAVCDSGGAIKEDIASPFDVSSFPVMQGLLPGAIPCIIRNRIAPGDRIRAYYCRQGSEEWIMMRRYDSYAQQEIPLEPDPDDPAEEIAAATSLAFDRTTRRLTLRTLYGAAVRLTAADGRTLHDAAAGSDAIGIDLSGAAAGAYTLSIGSNGEVYTLRIDL